MQYFFAILASIVQQRLITVVYGLGAAPSACAAQKLAKARNIDGIFRLKI